MIKEKRSQRWVSFQQWLEGTEHKVAIPFAARLAELTKPVAVRLRRTFTHVLSLIRAHTILHQLSRERDNDGKIIATPEDYRSVRALVADLVNDAAEVTVPETVRQTIEVVQRLCTGDEEAGVSVSEVAKELKLDKSAASRRVKVALDRGFLKNLETVKGRPYKLVVGDDLPKSIDILPEPEALVDRCTVAPENEGINATPASNRTEHHRDPVQVPAVHASENWEEGML